ncbi:NUDIX hydrolase [Nocardioides sp. NPDC000445]|uniref:NUDIX hydrolase n=1 Tax=Nocardioides sp. NPDC000445 TaxID=3154257 RepID=UPI003323BC80
MHGGYVEPGETPIGACEREVKELGLDRQITKLLVADWAPSEKEGDKILFVFDSGTLSQAERDAIALPPDELQRYGYLPESEMPNLLIPRLARRVQAAIDARREAQMAYLEHGEATPSAESVWWTTEDVAKPLEVAGPTIRAYAARGQMPSPGKHVERTALCRPEVIDSSNAQRSRKRV